MDFLNSYVDETEGTNKSYVLVDVIKWKIL